MSHDLLAELEVRRALHSRACRLVDALEDSPDRVQTVRDVLTSVRDEALLIRGPEVQLTLQAIERAALLAALNRCNGVQVDASKLLAISPG